MELQFLLARDKDETFHFFPTSRSPVAIGKVIAGMANHKGGHLLFGISNIQGKPDPVGVSDDFKVTKAIQKAIGTLSPRPEVETRTVEWKESSKAKEKSLVVVRIHIAPEKIFQEEIYWVRKGSKTKSVPLLSKLEELRPGIIDLISEAKLKEALNLIKEELPDLNEYTVLLLGELNKVNKEYLMGQIPKSELDPTIQRINQAVLRLIEFS